MSKRAPPSTLQLGRLAAAGLHLLASAAVAAAMALLIFRLWYPPPFNVIAGGATLFMLIVSVDVVLGPATDGGYYLLGCAGQLPPIFGSACRPK